MTVTSESIEQMLAAMEGKQIRCPKCGESEVYYIGVQFDARECHLPITGGAVFGDGDYYDPPAGFYEEHNIPHYFLLCAAPTGEGGAECQTFFRPPADTPVSYDEHAASPTTLRRNHATIDRYQTASDDGVVCGHAECGQRVYLIVTNKDSGSCMWTHDPNLADAQEPGQRKCPNGKTWANARVPTV